MKKTSSNPLQTEVMEVTEGMELIEVPIYAQYTALQ
jgi:hypothetical protein